LVIGRGIVILGHLSDYFGDRLRRTLGDAEADEFLINGVIGGRLLGKQLPGIGAERARQSQKLVECDALVAGLDIGEGRTAHVAVLRNPLLRQPTLAAQPPQGRA
jgi:hypothetical protein